MGAALPDPPAWDVEAWLNTDGETLTLESLRGKVVVLEGFQMLCPACVSHGIPLLQRIARVFGEDVQVVGLHTVFEHHAGMGRASLEAFLHEYRVAFPVGVDRPGPGDVPRTMEAYRMRGTPSLLLFDRAGKLRAHHFGQLDDLALGAEIGALVSEEAPTRVEGG